jgi:hypothetical protein
VSDQKAEFRYIIRETGGGYLYYEFICRIVC